MDIDLTSHSHTELVHLVKQITRELSGRRYSLQHMPNDILHRFLAFLDDTAAICFMYALCSPIVNPPLTGRLQLYQLSGEFKRRTMSCELQRTLHRLTEQVLFQLRETTFITARVFANWSPFAGHVAVSIAKIYWSDSMPHARIECDNLALHTIVKRSVHKDCRQIRLAVHIEVPCREGFCVVSAREKYRILPTPMGIMTFRA